MKLSDKTVSMIREVIGEELLGHLIPTECLYYVLTDKLGMSNGCAKFFAVKCHGGGRVFDAEEFSRLTTQKWKKHQMPAKTASRFIKRYMVGGRIKEINKRPYVWELNGFESNEPPFIAGYSREPDGTVGGIQPVEQEELIWGMASEV